MRVTDGRGKAVRLVVPYFLLASLWILLSDHLANLLLPGTPIPQTVKGLAFVLVTSALLYRLLVPTFADLHERLQKQKEESEARLAADQALRDSLDVQVALVQELHHRVKNNLQVLNSLISLQMAASDEETQRQLLKRVVERIRSISVVEEELYQQKQLNAIELAPVISKLISYLDPGEHPVRPQILQQIADVRIPLNDAVPIALITQELVTNALTHAFPEGSMEGAVVEVALRRERAAYLLTVRDNGRGLESAGPVADGSTMGFSIIETLTEQLGAELTYRNDGGAAFHLTVPVPQALPEAGEPLAG